MIIELTYNSWYAFIDSIDRSIIDEQHVETDVEQETYVETRWQKWKIDGTRDISILLDVKIG